MDVLRALSYRLVRPRVEAHGRHRIRRRWLVWAVERNDWVGPQDMPAHRRASHWRRVGWRRRRVEAASLAERLDRDSPHQRALAFRLAVVHPPVPSCPCRCGGQSCACTAAAWCGCRTPGCVTCTGQRALTRPAPAKHARA